MNDETRPPGYRIHYEPHDKRVRVVWQGVTVADSRRAIRVHETRLEPVFYLPRDDVRMDLAERTTYTTHCPFKGNASYWSLRVGDALAENALWSYEEPTQEARPIAGYIAFYRNRMDAWYEEDAPVEIDPIHDTRGHGNPYVDWLMRDAWEATSMGELLSRLALLLSSHGASLLRANLLVRTLHPQVMGAAHVWSRGEDEIDHHELAHNEAAEERFLSSPFVPIFEGRGGIRRRLDGSEPLDFPILRELAEEGATDYVAMPLAFSDGQIHALTLATDAPDGFDVETLGHIHEILPLIARLVEVHSLRHTARSLLDTYLGRHTGGRVLDGLIRRGDGEEIPAVIWWADLRGSTGLAERLPRARYLQLLNHFFESTAGVVIEHGGEVLKFIGDAVMAIFPLREIPDAADRALDSAIEALATIRKLELPDLDQPMQIALALHRGDVNYGNVGVAGRLDFTVTGPAVNEVARLEGLSKSLGQTLVASGPFADLVPGRLHSLGSHALRGVSGEHEVFGLPPA